MKIIAADNPDVGKIEWQLSEEFGLIMERGTKMRALTEEESITLSEGISKDIELFFELLILAIKTSPQNLSAITEVHNFMKVKMAYELHNKQ